MVYNIIEKYYLKVTIFYYNDNNIKLNTKYFYNNITLLKI